MFYLCHAYLKDEGFFAGRQPVLHEMEMTDDGWVRFKTGRVATATQPVPFKGTVQKISPVFKDKFNGSRLNAGWSWNYPYSDIDAQVSGGSLFLSGKPKDGNRYGTALCIRPQSPHYICETEVVNDNGSMKGLTVYGDSRNLVIWGMEGRELVLKGIVKDAEHTLFRMPCDGNVFLRMEVDSGHSFRFWWSKDGKDWKEAGSDGLDGSALARWDRVQRPGLIHCGRPEEPARFSYFMIENI